MRGVRHNPPMQNPILSVQNLRKRYGDSTVVDDVSFDITPGECLGVIGPNGAGKTTTIRMCLGLTAPDDGVSATVAQFAAVTTVAVFGYLLDILISARRNGNFDICRYGVGYERGILTGVKKAELQVAGHTFYN